uniref:Uncharacterized protein n=1 Tax=Spongospora subterranea TaxID=70186 RepID=A0A0H5QP68_9EUKA|eukprot:CRZ03885.1 hypothetical protein [Spongospora subterranea]
MKVGPLNHRVDGDPHWAKCSHWRSGRYAKWPVVIKVGLWRQSSISHIDIITSGVLTPINVHISSKLLSQTRTIASRELEVSSSGLDHNLHVSLVEPIIADAIILQIDGCYEIYENTYNQVYLKRIRLFGFVPDFGKGVNCSASQLMVHSYVRLLSQTGPPLVDTTVSVIDDSSSTRHIDEILSAIGLNIFDSKTLGQVVPPELKLLADHCTTHLGYLNKRCRQCDRLNLTQEAQILRNSINTLSQIESEARSVEQALRLAVLLNDSKQEATLRNNISDLMGKALELTAMLDKTDPARLDLSQTKENKVGDVVTSKESMAGISELNDYQNSSLIDNNISDTIEPLFEIIGRDTARSFLSKSTTIRLNALQHALLYVKSPSNHFSSHIRLVFCRTIVKLFINDDSNDIRLFLLTLVCLLPTNARENVSLAVVLCSDRCERIRHDAVEVLLSHWLRSSNRVFIVEQLSSPILAAPDDWRIYLGRCYAINEIICRYGCGEGSHLKLEDIMAFISLALKHGRQSVRSAAASVCNRLESQIPASEIDRYLVDINPLKMLPDIPVSFGNVDTLSHSASQIRDTNSDGVEPVTRNDGPSSFNVKTQILKLWSL